MKRQHFKQYLTLILTLILALQGLLTSAVQMQPVIAADADPHDLTTKLSDPKTILENASVTFADEQGNPVPSDQVTSDTRMSFHADWRIPDDVDLKAGDYYEFQLPAQMAHQGIAVSGMPILDKEGKKIADYTVTDSGVVRLTFNQWAADSEHVSGDFDHTSHGVNGNTGGHQEVVLPFNQETDQTTPIEVHTIKGLTKETKRKSNSADISDVITWTLNANNRHVLMTDGYIDEAIPDSLRLDSIRVTESSIDANDKVTPTKVVLKQDVDFTVEDAQVDGKAVKRIRFIGKYQSTKASFQLQVVTYLADPTYDHIFETITNTAKLHYGNEFVTDPEPAGDSAFVNYTAKKELTKKYIGATGGEGNYGWEVHYNESGRNIPAGTMLTDTLDNRQSFIDPSAAKSGFWFGTGRISGADGKLIQDKPLKENDDYTWEIQGQKLIIKTMHDIKAPLFLKYGVHVDQPKDDEVLTNSIEDNHEQSLSATGKVDTTPPIALKKFFAPSDDKNHQTKWEVDINGNHQRIEAGHVFEDAMTANDSDTKNPIAGSLIWLMDKSWKLVDSDDGNRELVDGKDYRLEQGDSKYKFNLTILKATTHELRLSYTSQHDAKLDDKKTYYHNSFHDDFGNHAEKDYSPASNDGKWGHWHPEGNYFEWHILFNTEHNEMQDATLIDPIQDNQELLVGTDQLPSTAIYKRNAETGEYTVPVDLEEAGITYHYDKNTKKVQFNFKDGDTTAYEVVIRTTPVDLTKEMTGKNTATFTTEGRPETLEATPVKPKNVGKLVEKSGGVDKDNVAYVNWKVQVNLANAKLRNVVVTDIASANQIIDKDSIKIYPATLDANGIAVPDRKNPLVLGKAYKLETTIDGESGDTTTKVIFADELTQPYIIEYRSEANTTLLSEKVTNKAIITGDQIKDSSVPEGGGVWVTRNSATGNRDASTGSIRILKTAKTEDGQPLKGAEFTLTPAGADGKPDESKARTAIVTDDKGEASFGNLLTGTYFIKEVKAPNGYQINPEYAGDGKKIDVTFVRSKPKVVELKVVDQPTDAFLPRTGGWQAGAILIAGMMTLLLSGVVIRRRTGKEAD